MEKTLHRNEHDKVIAGVASGLADYLEIEKTIVKLLFVLSTIFLGGAGIVVYIIIWIIAPVNNDPNYNYKKFSQFFNQPNTPGSTFNSPFSSTTEEQKEQNKWNTPNFEQFKPKKDHTFNTIAGVILIILGLFFGLRQMGLIPFWFSFHHILRLWPIAIIAIGLSLLLRKKNKDDWDKFKQNQEQEKPTDENNNNN